MSGPWWRDAACYQIYVRSFADGNGDGVGDIPGITEHLDYLDRLGVDAIWLTPFYESPQNDHGYDVTDYRVVERARYIFRDGRAGGTEPPSNWRSVFGGPAWTQVDDGQWYLHIFDESQPDFDWDNPKVGHEFDSILRFWLDRGVDGFRIDVAHGMFKAEGLPDIEGLTGGGDVVGELGEVLTEWDRPYWDQPGVHAVYRRWNQLLAEYDGDRMAIGEAWVSSAESMARYVRADELQQVFNFHWLDAPWAADALRHVIDQTYAAVGPVGATPTWVLSNHDVPRTVTRYGDGELGLSRAKAAMLTMLALPGSAYVYMGEELGLPQVDVPPADRQDPTWLRGGAIGRDGCRVPIPWSGARPPFGFSPADVARCARVPPSWHRRRARPHLCGQLRRHRRTGRRPGRSDRPVRAGRDVRGAASQHRRLVPRLTVGCRQAKALARGVDNRLPVPGWRRTVLRTRIGGGPKNE